jgi:type IV pilus assembly protein PilM
MKSPARVAALNLGMQTVTMAVFEPSSGGGITLAGFAQSDLVSDPAADAARTGQLKIVLGEMVSKLGWKGGPCACAIPSQGVFARFVQIPKVEPAAVGQVLFFEAQQNVPYPIEDVAWAYQILPDKDEGKLSALIIATKTDALEATVEALAAAQLTPNLIETSPTALYNAFRYNYPDARGCSLLIDIGSRATNLLFIEGSDFFIRTLPIGGNSITAALHKKFEGRSFNEVEQFKRAEGLIPPPGNFTGAKNEDIAEMGKIARTVMTRIHNEITRSVTFYRTTQKGSAPMRAFLAGGGVSMPYTLEFFNEKLSLPIEFFNPIRRVSVGPGVDAANLSRAAHLLGECVGLALRESSGECPVAISLKAPSLEQAAADHRRRPFLVAAAVGLVAAVGLLGLYYHSAAAAVARTNAGLQSTIAPLENIAGQISQLNTERARLLEDGADLAAAPLLRAGWVEIINELNQRQPEKFIWVTKLSPHPAVPGFASGGKAGESAPAGASGAAGDGARPQVTGIAIEGLYLENEAEAGVVDQFVQSLSESPLFAITEENKGSVVQVRAAQSGSHWAYEYKLIVPLKRPIPL